MPQTGHSCRCRSPLWCVRARVRLLACRCVLTYAPAEGPPALAVLGRVLLDQAVLAYAADAQVGIGGVWGLGGWGWGVRQCCCCCCALWDMTGGRGAHEGSVCPLSLSSLKEEP